MHSHSLGVSQVGGCCDPMQVNLDIVTWKLRFMHPFYKIDNSKAVSVDPAANTRLPWN